MGGQKSTFALPPDIEAELQIRVKAGEFGSIEEAIQTALRYYLERHSHERMKAYVQEEIQAALNEPS
jgi:Arc/MetJ-type ribon-helix-helix transcriptional regulator